MPVTENVNPPECAALESAAAALVGPGSSVSEGGSQCQFYGQESGSGEGLSWRLLVTGDAVIYPTLDFERATTAGFSSAEGMVEAEAPEGWTVAATRTYEEPDPDFPESITEHFLYYGGPSVAGLLTCHLQLTNGGSAGAAPPAAPTIDQAALLTFCDAAKSQMVTAAD